MARPDNVRYMKSHEWAREDGGLVSVGISDYAVEQLNKEIVFVELPVVGKKLAAGDAFGTIESVKAASDLYAPVSGVVKEVNQAVVDDPALVAEGPYGEGWLIKIEPSDAGELGGLLSAAEYEAQVTAEGH